MSSAAPRELSTAGRTALRAARAGVWAARRARGTAAAVKADATRVSAADYAAQAAIIGQLPHDAHVLAEEDSAAAPHTVLAAASAALGLADVAALRRLLRRRGDGGVWYVDPIDGTEGFLRAAAWAVGVASRGGPAALALPARDTVLVADRALWRCDGEQVPVRPAVQRLRHPVRWHFSPAGSERALPELPPPTRLCCGSLIKYGEVALGDSHALVQAVPLGVVPVWDHAAGVAAVLAAGGTVTDIEGNLLRFGDDHLLRVPALAFVATAPGVDHQWWLEVAARVVQRTRSLGGSA